MTEKLYTHGEIEDLLEKASLLGFSLEQGSELESLTLEELERLVTQKQ